jgi:hypothetical protein
MDGFPSKEPRKFSAFTREQKVGFVLLIAIGIFGVVFGVRSFPANLSRPFEIQLASYTGPEFLTETQKESREIERQKTSDTDADGLVDYDELYVFKTSPYLEDSDSDGFDDKTEVYSGNDPNCPSDKDCGRTLVQSSEAATPVMDTSNFLQGVLNVDPSRFEGVSLDTPEDIKNFFASMGVEEVKGMLRAQGVPQETIDQISDEDLMELFGAAIEQAAADGELAESLQEEAAAAEEESSEEADESGY